MGFQVGRAVGAGTDVFMKAWKDFEEADRAREASERAEDANQRAERADARAAATAARENAERADKLSQYRALGGAPPTTPAAAPAAGLPTPGPAVGVRPVGAPEMTTVAPSSGAFPSPMRVGGTASPDPGSEPPDSMRTGPMPVTPDPGSAPPSDMRTSPARALAPEPGPTPASDEASNYNPDTSYAPAATPAATPATTAGGLPARGAPAATPTSAPAATTPSGDLIVPDRGPTIDRLRAAVRGAKTAAGAETAYKLLQEEIERKSADEDRVVKHRLLRAQTMASEASARHSDAATRHSDAATRTEDMRTRVSKFEGDVKEREVVRGGYADRTRVLLGAIDTLSGKDPGAAVNDPKITNQTNAIMDMARSAYEWMPDKMDMSWKRTKLADGSDGILMTLKDKEGKLPDRVQEIRTVDDIRNLGRIMGLSSDPELYVKTLAATEASRYSVEAAKRAEALARATHPVEIEERKGLLDSLKEQNSIMETLKDPMKALRERASMEAAADRAAIGNPKLMTPDKVTKNEDGTTVVTPGGNVLRKIINASLPPDYVTVKSPATGKDERISSAMAVGRAGDTMPKLLKAHDGNEAAAIAETELTWKRQGWNANQIQVMKEDLRRYLEALQLRSVTPGNVRDDNDPATMGGLPGGPSGAAPTTPSDPYSFYPGPATPGAETMGSTFRRLITSPAPERPAPRRDPERSIRERMYREGGLPIVTR